MELPFLIYSIIALGIILFFLKYEKKKWFMTLIIAWLLGCPILAQPKYIISIKQLGIDLQPNRLLFLILLLVVLFRLIQKVYLMIFQKKEFSLKFDMYEFWMVAYFISSIFAYLVNFEFVSIRLMVTNITNVLAFFLVYFFARKEMNSKDFYILAIILFFVGVVSSVIGIYQFLIDPNFFRFGIIRPAFSTFFRANGLFIQEFEQGMFLIFAFIICWEAFPTVKLRSILAVILGLGVFTTMHRLCWILFLVSFLGLWLITTRKHNVLLEATGLLTLVIIFLSVWNFAGSLGSSNQFINDMLTERVGVDNLTIRMDLNYFAIRLIQEYPFGVGEYETETYQQEAYNQGIRYINDAKTDAALIIHNGFLSAGVRYGWLGLITFLMIFISSIFFFLRNSNHFGKHAYIPIFIILVYFLFNSTQDFSFFGQELSVIFGLLLGSFAAHIDSNKMSLKVNQVAHDGLENL
jgi:hypothetical protein